MPPRLAIIIPYYNERDYLPATLDSLAKQLCRDFTLILVDNGSTDGSEDVARAVMARHPDIEVEFLFNATPGQLPTLEHGLKAVETPFVASCDADTLYPPHYVGLCLELFDAQPEKGKAVVGVMAIDLYGSPDSPEGRGRIRKIMRKSRLFSSQCHAGGYAQAYRTEALRASGGFESKQWPYLLYDHELYERMRQLGAIRYHPDHFCFPSDRRADRGSVGWTRGERMVYRFTPAKWKSWFFREFLARRFAERGLVQVKLRERNF